MSVERRAATRFRKFLEVDANGVPAHTTNVSETGVQLSCPTLRVHRLREAQASDGGLRLTMTLPGGEMIAARASIVHETDYDGEYLLGIRFEAFDGDGEARWASHVRADAPNA